MSGIGYILVLSYAGFLIWLAIRGVRSRWSSSAQRAITYGLIPAGLAAIFWFGMYLSGDSPQPIARGEVGVGPRSTLDAVCPGLLIHAADVLLGPAGKQAADMTTQREQGWTEVHQIVVQVSEKPSRRVASDIKATGNRCYFDISPDMSTVAVSKRACMALCKNQAFDQIQGKPYLAYFGADGSARYMQ